MLINAKSSEWGYSSYGQGCETLLKNATMFGTEPNNKEIEIPDRHLQVSDQDSVRAAIGQGGGGY